MDAACNCSKIIHIILNVCTHYAVRSPGVSFYPNAKGGKAIGITSHQKVRAPSHPLPHLSHPFIFHLPFLFPFPATQFLIKGLGSGVWATPQPKLNLVQ